MTSHRTARGKPSKQHSGARDQKARSEKPNPVLALGSMGSRQEHLWSVTKILLTLIACVLHSRQRFARKPNWNFSWLKAQQLSCGACGAYRHWRRQSFKGERES